MVEIKYFNIGLSSRFGILFITSGFVSCFCSFYYIPRMIISPNVGNFVNLGFTIGIGLISMGIALISIGISKDSKQIAEESDKKMTALAELNFVEKNATIYSYIININRIEINDIKRIIRDLEAAFKVVIWVKDIKTKKNFIDALIELTELLLEKKILQNVKESIKVVYRELLEDSKRFEYKVNKIDILKMRI